MGKYSKYLSEIGDSKSICLLCGHEFNKQKYSSTSVLAYHFRTKHMKEWNDIQGNICMEIGEGEPILKKPKLEPVESFASSAPDESVNAIINRAVMQLIASAGLPLNLVDTPAWKNFCSIAIPDFNCRGREEFQRVELENLYQEYRLKIFYELKEAPYVSIGFEGWTDSSNEHQYLAINAFFVKNDELSFRVIGIVEIRSRSHTDDFLIQKLESVTAEFDVGEKICAIVSDGSPDVKSPSELLGLPNFDCLAHTINAAVREGIESSKSFNLVLGKLRIFNNILNKSSNGRREYEEVRTTLDVPLLALEKHIEVRWNTVHAAFERALKVKGTIDSLSTETEEWPKLTETDWNTAAGVVEIMQPIVDATTMIQNHGMTSSAIIPLCKVLIRELSEMKKFEEFCSSMVRKLQEELEKYKKIEFLIIGMMLDIRFKDDFAEDQWKQLLLEALLDSSKVEDDDVIVPTEMSFIQTADNPFSRFMQARTPEVWPSFNSQKEAIKAEYTKWFSEKSDMDQCPIEYWNRSSSMEKFPNLQRLQKKYLCAPAMTSEAENLFPSPRIVLKENRKLLGAENFSKLLFLQQNIRLMGFGPQINSDAFSFFV